MIENLVKIPSTLISIETFTKQCACTYDFIVELLEPWLLMK
jgi:hypothetical protein